MGQEAEGIRLGWGLVRSGEGHRYGGDGAVRGGIGKGMWWKMELFSPCPTSVNLTSLNPTVPPQCIETCSF